MRCVAAVVFDMDGVLVDSEPLHLRSTRAALGTRGASSTERDNQVFFGATDAEMLRVLQSRGLLAGRPRPAEPGEPGQSAGVGRGRAGGGRGVESLQ